MHYDVFLSHNHADKAWTRRLFESLGRHDYNGRNLRPWLDERVLDPGELSSPRELFSALDRSRMLLVVVSAASLASSWVAREIAYFLSSHATDDVVLARLDSAELPDRIAAARSIDCRHGSGDEALAGLLCPHADDEAVRDHRRDVRRASAEVAIGLAHGLDDDAIAHWHQALLSPDMADAAQEGIALAGFDRAGQHLCEMDLPGEGAHWTAVATHSMALILGEFLALAIMRHPRYAQVGARFVRKDLAAATQPRFLTLRNRALRGQSTPPSTTHLLLTAARAAEKLAEVAPDEVDLSLLAALLERLDARTESTPVRVIAVMVGRTLGRLRERPTVALLLHALLRRRGHASRQAVATATSIGIDGDDGPLSFTAEMTRLTMEAGPAWPPESEPMARIRGLRADTHPSPEALRALAPDVIVAPHPTSLENGPMAGRAHRITLQNMEPMAARLGPQDIAVLTEPRIVDALFDRVGGFLVRSDQVDAPLGRRLAMRQARCASFDRYVIDQIADGTALALWSTDEGEAARNLLRPPAH